MPTIAKTHSRPLRSVHQAILIRVAKFRRDDARLFFVDGLHRNVLRMIFSLKVTEFDALQEKFPRLSPRMLSVIIDRAEQATFIKRGRHSTGGNGYFITPLGLRVIDTETISS